MKKVDAISVFSQLKTTLSKLYPIADWTMSSRRRLSMRSKIRLGLLQTGP